MSDPILPGATLGVLGGGQLGAMFTMAAGRLGYRVAVWDPDPEAPAHRIADVSLKAPFMEDTTRNRFEHEVSAVTYEWENIPAVVAEAVERVLPVRPGSGILRLLQHRLDQKSFLATRGFPVAAFQPIVDPTELTNAADKVGFPCLCKTATAGYDGKGQWRLSSREQAMELQKQLSRSASSHSRWIVEQFIEFQKELSVLVVRGVDGEQRVYPVAENIHQAGILRVTSVPANISPQIETQAKELASASIEALNGVGVFCIELFLKEHGTLCINEIAPRPHNSGHYTLDSCTTSQFEQQVRALCGLPLGEVQMLCPAVMVNLIGDDLRRVTSKDALASLLRTPGAKFHDYRKQSIRERRKMGHVTFLDRNSAQARESADRLLRFLQGSDTSQIPATPKG